MKNKIKNLNNSLLYNLILFDFILLESSTKKISNFFIQKFRIIKNSLIQNLISLPIFVLLQSFKRFINFFYFITNFPGMHRTRIFCEELNLKVFIFLLKKFKINYYFKFESNFIQFSEIAKDRSLKSILYLEHQLSKSELLSLFLNNVYLLASINSIEEKTVSTYKIFTQLNDYKKIIFLGLILVSIFKSSKFIKNLTYLNKLQQNSLKPLKTLKFSKNYLKKKIKKIHILLKNFIKKKKLSRFLLRFIYYKKKKLKILQNKIAKIKKTKIKALQTNKNKLKKKLEVSQNKIAKIKKIKVLQNNTAKLAHNKILQNSKKKIKKTKSKFSQNNSKHYTQTYESTK